MSLIVAVWELGVPLESESLNTGVLNMGGSRTRGFKHGVRGGLGVCGPRV